MFSKKIMEFDFKLSGQSQYLWTEDSPSEAGAVQCQKNSLKTLNSSSRDRKLMDHRDPIFFLSFLQCQKPLSVLWKMFLKFSLAVINNFKLDIIRKLIFIQLSKRILQSLSPGKYYLQFLKVHLPQVCTGVHQLTLLSILIRRKFCDQAKSRCLSDRMEMTFLSHTRIV